MTARPMKRTRRRMAAVAVASVAAVAATAATAAAADTSGAQSSSGDFQAGGIHVTYDAQRAAGQKSTQATGTFTAEGAPVAVMGLPPEVGKIRLAGPISCLETHGNDTSFYYKFDNTSTSGVLDKVGAGMIVSLHKGADGKTQMGFVPMLDGMVPTIGCDTSALPQGGALLSATSGTFQNGD
ncbi:hypothetical protein [Patulibacter minatonensis]|uniref:hypothetical protein n=1 Tax=Patulibacter minatonensis TaxID=298163 RepID=UPI00047CED71|nr:hypothetical protein [Patulibacter minatonensis]